jgi:hypothetical protein
MRTATQHTRHLRAVTLILALVASATVRAQVARAAAVQRVSAIEITVSDVDRMAALRANGGAGIELLEYLTPPDGRPFPVNERANDLVRRETEIESHDLSSTFRTLLEAHSTLISSDVASFPIELGYIEALEVRDPDGHVIRIHNTTSTASATAALGKPRKRRTCNDGRGASS